MRTPALVAAATAALVLHFHPGVVVAQEQSVPRLPEEIRGLLKEVERAYKDPAEIDKDILDELRKQYRDPKPDREAKIFPEIRRLYVTTPALEETILRELRRAYERPTPDQEARFFEAVRRGGQLPPGTIPPDLLTERAARAFGKLDRNADGVLNSDELPDVLRTQLARWDRGGDGTIDRAEYLEYFRAGLKWVADAVASGELPAKLPKRVGPEPTATPVTPAAATDRRGTALPGPTNLPDWFSSLDADQDGQVGLYEWKKAGRPIREFLAMDRNNDGYLESKELLAYLATHPSPAEVRQKGR
jgi:hypothetical protein